MLSGTDVWLPYIKWAYQDHCHTWLLCYGMVMVVTVEEATAFTFQATAGRQGGRAQGTEHPPSLFKLRRADRAQGTEWRG